MYRYNKLNPEQRKQVVEERIQRGFPAHAPPHPVREATYYLLTAACYHHQPHLRFPARRQHLLNLYFQRAEEAGLRICAWVVLPNHYHLLAYIPERQKAAEVIRRIHSATAYEWNAAEAATGRRVWYRYTDRAIRSERHYYATINYIHYNPVKHRLCQDPTDWLESSVHWYAQYFGIGHLKRWELEYPIGEYGKGWDEF